MPIVYKCSFYFVLFYYYSIETSRFEVDTSGAVIFREVSRSLIEFLERPIGCSSTTFLAQLTNESMINIV
jgi:hypothetical protein